MQPQPGDRRFEPPRAKPVLVAYDGSLSARTAASWGVVEAASTGRPLRLVHVMRWPLPELDGLDLPESVHDVARARQAATDLVAAGVDRCTQREPRVDVRGEVLIGGTVDLLAKLAGDAHLLVLGASGQTASPQVLLGSSAAELARRVNVSVAVIRDVPAQPTGHGIVIGMDGSTAAAHAARSGFDIAARRGLEVVVVHAWCDLPLRALGAAEIDQGAARRAGFDLLRRQLAEARQRHPGVDVREVVSVDRPARALLDQAAGADLLVVGRHGRAASTDMALGSVSHAVLHYAPCPVLVAT